MQSNTYIRIFQTPNIRILFFERIPAACDSYDVELILAILSFNIYFIHRSLLEF